MLYFLLLLTSINLSKIEKVKDSKKIKKETRSKKIKEKKKEKKQRKYNAKQRTLLRQDEHHSKYANFDNISYQFIDNESDCVDTIISNYHNKLIPVSFTSNNGDLINYNNNLIYHYLMMNLHTKSQSEYYKRHLFIDVIMEHTIRVVLYHHNLPVEIIDYIIKILGNMWARNPKNTYRVTQNMFRATNSVIESLPTYSKHFDYYDTLCKDKEDLEEFIDDMFW